MSQKRAGKGRATMSRRLVMQERERKRQQRQRLLRRSLQIGIPVVAIVLALVVVLAVTGGGGGGPSALTNPTITPGPTPTPSAGFTGTTTSCAPTAGTITDTAGNQKPQWLDHPARMIDTTSTLVAKIQTTSGTIEAALSPTIAPNTVNSFVFLARCGYYDNTIVHRVAKDFVLQAGDPIGTGRGGPGYTVPDELPPAAGYPAGVLAMANSGPGTVGSQFFIVTGSGGANLPASYSLFGTVIAGFEVAKSIELTPATNERGPGAQDGRPDTTVTITSITIEDRATPPPPATTAQPGLTDPSETTAAP